MIRSPEPPLTADEALRLLDERITYNADRDEWVVPGDVGHRILMTRAVPEPERLDVERLGEAIRRFNANPLTAYLVDITYRKQATAIAAEYARLATKEPDHD